MFYEKVLRYLRVFFCFLGLVSCSTEDKQEVVVGSIFELQQKNFNQLDGWNKDNLSSFKIVLDDVCHLFEVKNLTKLKSSYFEISLNDYKKHCHVMQKINNDTKLKSYIEDNFQPYLVVSRNNNLGKFTSYYEASIRASYKKDSIYKYPIYGRPKDLVEINLKDFDKSLPDKRLVGRVSDGKLIKYYTREEIENNKIEAPIILWGDNLVDIHIMQIQGSAIASLPNGDEVRVGYADNNGHQFRGIGSILIEKGLINRKNSTMTDIRAWLNDNGDLARQSMLLNNRFIFHKLIEGRGPIGALGLPLVGGRSLAVDKDFIPLGLMMWLDTSAPDGQKIQKMVMSEDVGSAIKGAIRGDYFWGHGEKALAYAGGMNSKGRYFILLPKETKVDFYGR